MFIVYWCIVLTVTPFPTGGIITTEVFPSKTNLFLVYVSSLLYLGVIVATAVSSVVLVLIIVIIIVVIVRGFIIKKKSKCVN